MPTAADLRPGDVLLYKPVGIFGRIIAIKTWHADASHVEIYIGDGQSVASRDALGVNAYPWRNTELTHVLRPTRPFDLIRALHWFVTTAKGKPYGWLDLAAFVGLPLNTTGFFCSEFATDFLRAGGLPVFGTEPALSVAPFEFTLIPELLAPVWTAEPHDEALKGYRMQATKWIVAVTSAVGAMGAYAQLFGKYSPYVAAISTLALAANHSLVAQTGPTAEAK